MIDKVSFTREWLLEVNETLGWNRAEVQLKNLEKPIAALYLLEQLRVAGLDFYFKGGTSLLLLLGRIQRLSVDIDILMEEQPEDLGSVFDALCASNELFTRWEKQIRENPMSEHTDHFRFFYKPFIGDLEESYILLDLYRSRNPYTRIIEKEICSDVLNTVGTNIKVTLPDTEGLLADKLTAFAPNTIGVSLTAEPPRRPKRVEAIKQLYDIGNLFDQSSNIDTIRQTYHHVAVKEIENRGLSITPDEVLEDTARFANIVGHTGSIEQEEYNSFAKGYKDFSKFVVDLRFDVSEAVLAAAKVAYLVSLIKAERVEIEHYDESIDMSDWSLEGDLGEYKYTNPESFFYWYKSMIQLS